jgi:hypothetical protein
MEIAKNVKKTQTVKCGRCTAEYESKGTTGYCPGCRKMQEKHVCEILTKDGNFAFNDAEKVGEFMKTFPFKSIKLRLDLHGVLDTIDADTHLPVKDVCAISYVGKITKTRVDATLEIEQRIRNNQILFGVLVFRRGKRKSEPFVEVGSKAWFNQFLKNDEQCLFIDDSYDHVISVESIGVRSVQMFEHHKLIDFINDSLKK